MRKCTPARLSAVVRCLAGFQGGNCNFLHRIPNEEDEKRIGHGVDAFGRERHRTDREDMGGVGSFERNNKTLYLGGLKLRPGVNMEEVIRRQFGAFGEVDLINVIQSKAIAFVRFKLRLCAEFAKEAMADQPMEGEEIVNVRWANSDPNPIAQERDKIDTLAQAADAVQEKFPELWQQEVDMLKGQYPQTDANYDYSQYYGMDPNMYYQYYYAYQQQMAAAAAAGGDAEATDDDESKKRKRDAASGEDESSAKKQKPNDAADATPVVYPGYPYYYGYQPYYAAAAAAAAAAAPAESDATSAASSSAQPDQ